MRVFLPLFAATVTLFIHTYVCTEIIGGKEAKPHSRPYMAYIYTEIGNGQAATCDGALIDSSWVLTAAHCTINSSTIIKLGLHSLSNQGQYVQRFQVLNWIPHPHYNNLTFDNDVQLVQLNGTATSSNGVSPQKLPSAFSEVKAGTICKLAGWGRTSNDPKSNSDKLMEVSLPAISRDKCAEMWYPNKITKNMMCTLDPKTGKGSCNGDSGGPLICQEQLRGVVSYGLPCCGTLTFPPVYAFLNKDIVDWIKRQMENDNWIKREIKNLDWIKRGIKKK
ncbi:mast cell protease 1A-like [Hyperolius riggenbachi]|uniref:mast cell protease 1A-like n=1 Tax=Hyperolius riggenbachi TaxID=752182 RepID=UPI0035A28ED8